MIRYKEKAKDCQLIVKVRLPFGQSVSDNDLEFFARKCLRGFLRPKRVRSNTLEYVGPIAVPLYDRLKKPITSEKCSSVEQSGLGPSPCLHQ